MRLNIASRFGAVYGSIALPFLALLAVGPITQTVTVITGNENSGTYPDPEKSIRSLIATPAESKINGTYSTKHLFGTYSAGIQHVQGIAWMIDGRFALSHNSRADRRGLFIAQSSDSDTVMVNIGSGGDHPGGIQAAGKVVAIPISGNDKDEVVFMDCRKKELPMELPYLRISGAERTTGAAGLAYDSKRGCHWLVTTNAMFAYGFGPSTLYKSNGKSLFDPACRFTKSGEFSDVFTAQGGTQILFDPSGTMYIAALYRVEPSGEDNVDRKAKGMTTGVSEGTEMIALSKITDPTLSSTGGTLLVDRKLSDSGAWLAYEAGFRWGGTIMKGPDSKLWVAAVSRTLTYGPAQRYAKTKFWMPKPSIP